MKKILIGFMLVVLLAVPAFASNSNTDLGGITVGPAFKWLNVTPDGSSTTSKNTLTDIIVYVTETSYFGGSDNLGLSVGCGIDKTLALTTDGTKQDQDAVDAIPLNLSMYLHFQYKYDFSKTLALEAGIGPQFDMGYKESTLYSVTTKERTYSWAITAKVNALIHFDKSFALQAGCYLGLPLSYQKKTEVTYMGTTTYTTYKFKVSGFDLTPFVGAMFSF
jgi:hypothetical protein